MDIVVLLFLTSGLFLGWSLGSNDAANVFGTAVGTGMVRFATAATVCTIFVILGAVISGAGAAHTLGRLGAVNALAGSFAAAFAAAITVYWMTKAGLPVSTSQAIVGAILGWNWFSESVTDTDALFKILGTWIACPILSGLIAVPLFKLVTVILHRAKVHLLRLDVYTRVALVLAGAFGSYSLGANNIANVMGVFVPVSPFTTFKVGDWMTFTSVQQLFLLGAIAIGVGVFTYSKRVMLTVGAEIIPLSPIAAWVAVIAQSVVLFLFASEGLEHLLAAANLPTIPLVPVSSSQAVVGAVVGIGLLRGGRNIQWRILLNIGVGWVATPTLAAIVCFVSLFFLQNVFNQKVFTEVDYRLSQPVMEHLVEKGVSVEDLGDMTGVKFSSGIKFVDALRKRTELTSYQESIVLDAAEVFPTAITREKLETMDSQGLSSGQLKALQALGDQRFMYKWQIADALARGNPEWKLRPETKLNKIYNKRVQEQLDYVYRTFATKN